MKFYCSSLFSNLQGCEIKRSRSSNDMEVLVKTSTSIHKSPTKFPNVNQDSNTIQLHQLQTADNFQRITTTVKAIHLDDPIAVAGNKYKQDVTVADSTGTARFTLWETDIGKIEANTSYILSNVMVRTYQHIKYLTLPKMVHLFNRLKI